MSCFWETLYQTHLFSSISKREIIHYLKSKNKKANCIVNQKKLTQQQIDENFNAIKELNPQSYHNGYLTSMCEPVLCLVCNLFYVHIIHEWHLHKKVMICYSPIRCSHQQPISKHIHVICSNHGHAWYNKHIQMI